MKSGMDANLIANTVSRDVIAKDVARSSQYHSWEGLFLRHREAISGFLMDFWSFACSQSTCIDLVISLLKYASTGFCIFKFLDKIFLASREKKKQKQFELDQLEVQVDILNTKLANCEAERLERLRQIRRDVRRLSEVRAAVRGLVAADDALRRPLATDTDTDIGIGTGTAAVQDHDLTKKIQKLIFESCGNVGAEARDHSSTPDSVHSAPSDGDADADNECHLRVIRVTNVYKVAYLKHFIKQKRLRRAARQALLKKKMESIKKMLEEWQRALNAVITRKLSTLNLDEQFIDTASQEAMGDYSKQNYRDESCTDSDPRTDVGDPCYEDYSSAWVQNPYVNFPRGYDGAPETVTPRECSYFEDVPCHASQRLIHRDPSPGKGPHALFVLPEETSSQIAFEEFRKETGEIEK